MTEQTLSFSRNDSAKFFRTLNKRVNDYFKDNNIRRTGNWKIWVKTIVMFSLFLTPYFLILTLDLPTWVMLLLTIVMGIGMAGVGMNVMHDGNHGAFSDKDWINRLMGSSIYILAGNVYNWKVQHNVLHHTYTNIAGLDDDIDSIVFLRFSPAQPRHWFHRYQYLYAWFFYMIMTLFWMTAKDYLQVVRYKQHDLLIKQKVSLKQAILHITLYKLLYYMYILVLPILYSGQPWYFVLAGFLLMHFTSGLFLSCVFQPSHIMEASSFLKPAMVDGTNRMENSWAIHELANTTDFAPKSRLLTWFIGGLNYQIEHHLFTGVCHVHYKKIAPIVRSTAKEYNLPYHVQPTFFRALWEHARMLKRLGEP